MNNEELDLLLSEQREELMAAKTLIADLDFAFNLQMQEAMTASIALHTSAPLSPDGNDDVYTGVENDAVFDYTALILEDLNRLDQERRDREESEREAKRMRMDLDRRIHDQKFAREITRIPEDEWVKYGDNYEDPYGIGSSSSSSSSSWNMHESFRLYFKGLVSEEMIGDTRVVVGGVGVAICDPRDNLIWEVKKFLEGAESKSHEVAEIEGLIHGLNEALNLDLKNITFLCDDFMVYQYVTGRAEPRQSRLATMVNQVGRLQSKFSVCQPSLLARKDIKFVFKLAKDAIVSQIKWPEETSQGKSFKETCVICYEGIDIDKMFSVDGCYHRFCFSCMKQHAEVKLLDGTMVKCPKDGCESEVKVERCTKFLDHKLVNIMSQRIKESSIAVSDKIYCPYPKCSALMSKNEVLQYTRPFFIGVEQSGARKCMKCGHFFCINCKVPWHYNMTCYDHSRSNSNRNTGEAMVKSLADKQRWRQCAKCNHMVELVWGCYHITCRCGYEFCYTCGAEWKKKKATCSCPIWDERNILRNHGNRRR